MYVPPAVIGIGCAILTATLMRKLLGELRPVAGLDRRLREAARLGFRRALVPAAGPAPTGDGLAGLDVVRVATLRDALRAALAATPESAGEPVMSPVR